MTEPALQEAVLGAGAGGPLSIPTQWISAPSYIIYNNGGVVIGNPSGLNKGVGALNTQSIYINGILLNLNNYLLLGGGIMTGILTLSVDPVGSFDAATKKYVDSTEATINGNFANYLPKAGGTMTGFLTLSADPTTSLQASTKQYVDNKFSGLIGISDAPADGTIYGRQNGFWVNTQTIDVGTF